MTHWFSRLGSLQAKFLVINIPLVLLSTLVLFVIFELATFRTAFEELKNDLREVAATQAAVLADPIWNLNFDQIRLIVAAVSINRDVQGARVYDNRGDLLEEFGTGTIDTTGSKDLVMSVDVYHSDATDGKPIGKLILAMTDQHLQTATKARLLVAAGIALLVVLSGIASAIIAQRRTIGIPLQRMLQSIKFAKGVEGRKAVEWHSEDEMGVVISAFNDMQERQQAYETELRNARDHLEQRVQERTIEITNARQRLMDAIESTSEGFAFYDDHDRLEICNSRYQQLLYGGSELQALPGMFFEAIIRQAAKSGLIGNDDGDIDELVRKRLELHRNPREPLLQQRPDGRWVQISERNTADGGIVAVYTDITAIKQAEQMLREKTEDLERTVSELTAAQQSLVQAEKMASLGQFTAGIAHEIKNPLNFVNNFSEVSTELLEELKENLEGPLNALSDNKRDDSLDLLETISTNLTKIKEHGTRADGIVKSMLSHARDAPSTIQRTDLNALIEESLNLSYHGARAENQSFNVTLQRDYDPSVGKLDLFPQDIMRAFLNLISNGFYAVHKRQTESSDPDFKPTLSISTQNLGKEVKVSVRDNGVGIPATTVRQIFDPFFTTKPTGEGTGLGLSLSYETVVQQHRGLVEVETEEGEFTEFIITLPRTLSDESANGVTS